MRSFAGRCVVAVAAASLATFVSSPIGAQDVQVAVDPGPHYVGDAVSIRITARNFEEAPAPEASAPRPDSGKLDLVGVSPSVSQSITIVNGRMTRTRDVTHVFQFRFVPSRAGQVELGPFRVSQGSLQLAAAPVRLAVRDLPSSKDVRVEVRLPEGAVYVGERVPVRVEFTLERRLHQNLLNYDLRVPLFDMQQSFRLLEGSTPGDTKIVLQTGAGSLELKGTTRELNRNGKPHVVISLERTLVPLRPGRVEVPGATVSIQEGVRWRRDFFGGRRATQVRRFGAHDRDRTLEVKSIPIRGQPASFAGAIGTGFTLQVAADRSVVQVGDPITLTLTLRGEGLETARLPPLDSEGLLPKGAFRVPTGELTGELDRDEKHFAAVVRVLEERVEEIPALAYSWFDPDTKRYETSHSRPIALSVRSAEVIGAADVESDSDRSLDKLADPSASGAAVGPRPRSFALTGADLAIERDPAKMLVSVRATWGSPWLVGSLYGGALVLIPLARWQRQRLDVDPALTRCRRIVAAEEQRVREAGRLAPAESLTAVSQALRRMLAQVPEAASAELDAFLGECDARSYAPASQQREVDAALLERAVELARSIAERAAR